VAGNYTATRWISVVSLLRLLRMARLLSLSKASIFMFFITNFFTVKLFFIPVNSSPDKRLRSP
jgi:hypothetical protein